MKNFKSKNGFSIVEVLVASAFVAVLAVAGLTSYTYMRNLRNRSTDICRVHVASVVEKFRSIGYFSAINNKTPITVDRTFGGNPETSLLSKGIPDTQLWPSGVSILESAARPTLNNSILISSSINALLAIYNSNPAFCSAGASYTGSGLVPGLVTYPSPDLKDSNIILQIVPYNINSGAPLSPIACPSPLRIAPEPVNISGTSSAFGSSPPKARQGDTMYSTGLLVKVIENYTNEDGQAASCSIEQRFQYSPDLNPPLPPNFSQVIPAAPTTNCGPVNTSFQVNFGYDGTREIEPGAVLVCRDNSVTDDVAASGYGKFTCISGSTPQVLAVVSGGMTSMMPLTQTGLAYSAGYTARRADLSNEWKPCDQVTACGVAPASASLHPSSTLKQPKYSLSYTGLPVGCRINIEVAAIDTASNSSDNMLTAGVSGSPTVFNNSVTVISGDVLRPRCGNTICGSCGTSCGLTVAATYFRCGGCPPF